MLAPSAERVSAEADGAAVARLQELCPQRDRICAASGKAIDCERTIEIATKLKAGPRSVSGEEAIPNRLAVLASEPLVAIGSS
jgi:hypothetical protein